MTILTERIRLRPFEKQDLDEYFVITRDEKIKKYVRYAYTESKEELLETIEDYMVGDFVNDFYFVIEDIKTSSIIGAIIATRHIGNNLEMAYLIGCKYRRNGYATEAIECFIQNVAKPKNYNLLFQIRETNEASYKLAQKLGVEFTDVINEEDYRLYKLRSKYFKSLD